MYLRSTGKGTIIINYDFTQIYSNVQYLQHISLMSKKAFLFFHMWQNIIADFHKLQTSKGSLF
jgi:hypothetical protein